MKKTIDELRSELDSKIKFLEKLVLNVKSEPPLSEMRTQYCYSIATTLRSIVCYDKSDSSLISRCNLCERILFQLINNVEAMNVMPTYQLLSYTIDGRGVRATPLESVNDKTKVSSVLLTFDAWINEIVIDPKIPNFEPVSRYWLIKMVADQNGAHVQSTKDSRIIELTKTGVLPIRVLGEEYNREINAISIFTESIITIAMELIFSYSFLRQNKIEIEGPSNYDCYLYKFNKGYKYVTCIKGLSFNKCNPNNYYQCEVIKNDISNYIIRFINKKFSEVSIIKID